MPQRARLRTQVQPSVGAAVKSLAAVKDATLQLPAGLVELRAEIDGLQAEVGRLNGGIVALARAIETMKIPPRPAYAPSPSPSGSAGRERFDDRGSDLGHRSVLGRLLRRRK